MKMNNKNFKSILLLIQPFIFGYLSTIVSDYLFGAKGSFKYSAGYLKLKSLYSFVPRPYLFGIVWPILYILMGIAIMDTFVFIQYSLFFCRNYNFEYFSMGSNLLLL